MLSLILSISALAAPQLTLISSGTMNHARTNHSAMLLNDGTVMIYGEVLGGSGVIEKPEIFNPTTEVWAEETGTYWNDGTNPAVGGKCVVMGDDRVLCGTGDNDRSISIPSFDYMEFTDGYDTLSGNWVGPGVPGYQQSIRRWGAQPIMWANRVIFAGGYDAFNDPVKDADAYFWLSDWYNPGFADLNSFGGFEIADFSTWSARPEQYTDDPVDNSHFGSLPMIMGGWGSWAGGPTQARGEVLVYDPPNLEWRRMFSSTALSPRWAAGVGRCQYNNDIKYVVHTGGYTGNDWSINLNTMETGNPHSTATTSDNYVLYQLGTVDFNAWPDADMTMYEITDPSLLMIDERANHATSNGQDKFETMVWGGYSAKQGKALKSVEVLLCDEGFIWHHAVDMQQPRLGHTVTRLDDGSYLVVGGQTENGVIHQTWERYAWQ